MKVDERDGDFQDGPEPDARLLTRGAPIMSSN